MRGVVIAVLVLASGCRTERTWAELVQMTPGERLAPVWMATDELEYENGTEAMNCSASTVSVDPGLEVTTLGTDTWGGHCWVELDILLKSESTSGRHGATFLFVFDLCNVAGGECPAEYADQRQERTVTVQPI